MSIPSPAAEPPVTADPWSELAAALDLRLEEDAWGVQARGPSIDARRMAEGFVAALPDLGLLRVSGADSLRFLQGQLTNDVEHLSDGQARWYGYCTAKGRLLSTFLGWRDEEEVSLTVARPLAQALRKRLSMYVMRAKARISDASADLLLLGVGGHGARVSLEGLGLDVPAPMESARVGATSLVGLPAVPIAGNACPRWLLVLPAGEAGAVWEKLITGGSGPKAADLSLAVASTHDWRWTEVLAGIPRMVPETAELFVPQMLNLDLSGGVSFTKGCYPGQEVVARTHYLGKQRRRMQLGRVQGATPAPGSDVLDVAGRPVGRVVLAAGAPDGGVDLLFEAQLAAVADGVLSVSGAPITIGELPYALPS